MDLTSDKILNVMILMKLDLKNLDELIAASTRNNNNVNEILYKNSSELAKYFQIHVGTNLTITDLEGLLSPKESELSTLKNTAIKPTILEQCIHPTNPSFR